MSLWIGNNIEIDIKGKSHDKRIEGRMSSFNKGFKIDFDELNTFMERRSPGKGELISKRKENDIIHFISGIDGNTLNGEDIGIYILNEDVRSNDYNNMKLLRPGHSDYVSLLKFGRTFPGSGPFSGRLSAILTAFGGISLQFLNEYNIYVASKIISIKDIKRDGFDTLSNDRNELIYEDINDEMKELIRETRENKDSLGGIIQLKAINIPKALGYPYTNNLKARISNAIFSIPGVMGIEFGRGFEASILYGSENNDSYIYKDKEIIYKSNNSGGIQGGISNGKPIILNISIKPTASIGKKQRTVDIIEEKNSFIETKGRHDPAFILRVPPILESMFSLVILDELIEEGVL